MKIRVLQLINNYYVSSSLRGVEEASGTYCAYGYFDAIEVNDAFTIESDKKPYGFWRKMSEINFEKLNATCTRRIIPCITMEEADDDRDEQFWKTKDKPIVLVSLIRLKTEPNYKKKKLLEDLQTFRSETNIDIMFYYTSLHSELVMIVKGKSIKKCVNEVMRFRDRFMVLKSYTIFSIYEDELKIDSCIESEKVTLRLKGTVREKNKVEDFYDSLKSKLPQDATVVKYDLLGSNDLLVEISNIDIKNIVPLYKMGNLLTHNHYKDALYNIETEFLA